MDAYDFAPISTIGHNNAPNDKIEKDINMFEAAKTNYLADNRCTEYNPWSCDLIDSSFIRNKPFLNEEDGSEISNSMVNDLVAKVLDDDNTAQDALGISQNLNQCNNNQPIKRYNFQSYNNSMKHTQEPTCNTNVISSSYLNNESPKLYATSNGYIISNTNNQEYISIYNRLNNLSLNPSQRQGVENVYNRDYVNHIPRPLHQMGDNHGLLMPYSTSNNYHTYELPSLSQVHCPQSINWSKSSLNIDSNKDLSSNYPQTQLSNVDYNFNINSNIQLTDSPENLSNFYSQYNGMGQNIPQNCLNNNAISHEHIRDYNIGTSSCSYRPNSAMTDNSADSGFLSNSPPQLSPQNYFNIASNQYEEYKNIQETSNFNFETITVNDSLFLKQRQNQKFNEQNRKVLLHQYQNSNNNSNMSIPKSTPVPANNDLENFLIQQSMNTNVLKLMPLQAKDHDKNIEYSILNNSNHEYRQERLFPQLIDRQKGFFNNNNNNNNNNENTNIDKIFYPHQNQSSLSLIDQSKITNIYNYQNYENSSSQLNVPAGAQNIDNDAYRRFLSKQRHPRRMKNIPIIHAKNAASVLNNKMIQTPLNINNNPFWGVIPLAVNGSSAQTLDLDNGFRNGNSIKRSVPSRTLYLKLEQTYNQFKLLETERKKYETELVDNFPGKKITSTNNIPVPRLQGNPSRVDRLIIDHFREHARVITLIAKMERLRGATMNKEIHKSMENWLEAIKYVQECRKQEINHAIQRQKDVGSSQDDKDILTLANSIYDLTRASRYARTALYNAMQTTLLYDNEMEKKVVENSQDVVIELVPKEDDHVQETAPNNV